ncbi:hypothetical protein E2C01_031473 [Portunus trituberculatus]|uniref:Uncharacterized protein n=1 Tax=Portunus trituberculatus TaxID=210409 RepID=A0A5B7EXS2_PORTR|nr:hypothetical protein [Portunus trituberculatus]
MSWDLWCGVHFNDTLQLVPKTQTHADDCSLIFPSNRNHQQDTVDRINAVLHPEVDADKQQEDGHPQHFISILGVEVDAGLTFTNHAREVARGYSVEAELCLTCGEDF